MVGYEFTHVIHHFKGILRVPRNLKSADLSAGDGIYSTARTLLGSGFNPLDFNTWPMYGTLGVIIFILLRLNFMQSNFS